MRPHPLTPLRSTGSGETDTAGRVPTPYPVPLFTWQDPCRGQWRQVVDGMVVAVAPDKESLSWHDPSANERYREIMRRRKWGTWAG